MAAHQRAVQQALQQAEAQARQSIAALRSGRLGAAERAVRRAGRRGAGGALRRWGGAVGVGEARDEAKRRAAIQSDLEAARVRLGEREARAAGETARAAALGEEARQNAAELLALRA